MDPFGEPGVGSFTTDFERRLKEGCRNGVSLAVGTLCGETGGRAPTFGTPNDFRSFFPMPPHVPYGLRGLHSWLEV
jgi:hypothetical protein